MLILYYILTKTFGVIFFLVTFFSSHVIVMEGLSICLAREVTQSLVMMN
jgi:hypothetical protein